MLRKYYKKFEIVYVFVVVLFKITIFCINMVILVLLEMWYVFMNLGVIRVNFR